MTFNKMFASHPNSMHRNFMLDKDGAEDFIEDIMEELVDTTMDKIYDIYLDKQLLPFTVTMAKDAILQIIDVSYTYIYTYQISVN